MSYVALYRKFRPATFDEVKGQDHIVTTLRNQLMHNRVGHAYLFCGTRGTGKTTIAKILAKAVNCENPNENGPCCECASCKAIADGSAMNVIEMDAASNNGVDNIRQIKDSVQYSPAQGKYLVYIIDEAHNLSGGAYNALLKVLEEPPEYVIFMLATTDDYKLPITIKSRCQRFDFHRISLDTIADRLEEVVRNEGGQISRDAVRMIARAGDGSMRDALSVLDSCMSSVMDRELTRDDVMRIIGTVSVDLYMDLFKAVIEKNADKLIDIVNEAVWDGKDLTKFADDFTWFIRNVLFLKLSPDIKKDIDLPVEVADQLIELGKNIEKDTLMRDLNILQNLCTEIRNSSIKRVTLEMNLIRMMTPEMNLMGNAGTSGGAAVEAVPIMSDASADGSDKKSEAPVISSESISKIVQAEMDAGFEVRLRRELKEMINSGEFRLAGAADATDAPAQTASKPSAGPMDAKTRSNMIKDNIKRKYGAAMAEDIIGIASDWWTAIVPKLTGALQRAIKESVRGVIPSEDYKMGEPARLVVVLKKEMAGTMSYRYLDESEHNRSVLADQISQMKRREVQIDVIAKSEDEDRPEVSLDITKVIMFDNIEKRESED